MGSWPIFDEHLGVSPPSTVAPARSSALTWSGVHGPHSFGNVLHEASRPWAQTIISGADAEEFTHPWITSFILDPMKFETTLLQNGNNTGIEVPADVVDALGGGKRAAVTLEVNGFRFSSTLAVMGGRVLVPFSASKRAETGLSGGDQVTVEIGLDTAPRTVEVPSDLAEALEESGTRAAFDRLPPSARKAQVSNVENAKAAATRSRRISAIISKLSSP